MTDDEVKKAREDYDSLITGRNLTKKFYMSAKEELEELEKDSKVQKYIDLIEYVNLHRDYVESHSFNNSDDYDCRNRVFTDIAKNTKHSNKIYVFMGFFTRGEKITVEKEKISYALFSDLETLDTVTVPYKDYTYFRENNKVIKDIDEYKKRSEDYYQYRLFKIRKEFFNDLIETEQEVAVQKILR